MKCLRCQTEMEQYNINPPMEVFGKWHKPTLYSAETQKSHNIHSVFICEECGYAEFSTKFCNTPDI